VTHYLLEISCDWLFPAKAPLLGKSNSGFLDFSDRTRADRELLLGSRGMAARDEGVMTSPIGSLEDAGGKEKLGVEAASVRD